MAEIEKKGNCSMHYMYFYYYTFNTDNIFYINDFSFVKTFKADSNTKQKAK